MKTIYYEPAGRIHSSQWELINNPPEGCEFVTKKISPIVSNGFVFDKLRPLVLDRLMPLNYVKARLDSLLSMPEADMIYAYNHVVFREIPWVVQVEWAHILAGRDLKFFPKYKSRIEEKLSSKYCRGIITWTELAKESMLRNYDAEGFEDKIRVIPHAIRSSEYVRNYNCSSVGLLFVGSINTPKDFDAKGAMDVIKAFDILKAKHKDLTLTIRAEVPKNMDDVPGLTIIDQILPKQELEHLFMNADMFVFTSHLAQNTVVVEAMNYGLPIVASWIGSTYEEYVEDDVNGLVLPKNDIPYFVDNLILASETIHRHKLMESAYNDLEPLVNALERLIASPSLRERLGRDAKAGVDSGKFSIEHRNKLLLEMFDAKG